MTTLRRELRLKFVDILKSWNVHDEDLLATELTEAAMIVKFLCESKPKIEFKNADPAWAILAGVDISTESNIEEKEATDTFERDFVFGTLPWNSNSTWTKFYKFVVKIYSKDKNVWKDYVSWRNDEGKYKAYSNKKIRENPQAFMDTGYPEFEASKMYLKDKPKQDGSSGYYA